MYSFNSQEKQSKELLTESGTRIIFKTTRAGATVSLAKVAIENDLKIVVIVPKKKIAQELSTKIQKLLAKTPRIMLVGSNVDLCPKLDPKLDLVFQLRDNCKQCENRNNATKCPFQNLLQSEFDLLSLTYDKLQSLQLSDSATAEAILSKLAKADVVIFDEFSSVVLVNIQTITLASHVNGNETKKLSDQIRQQVPNPELWTLVLLRFLMDFENMKQGGVYRNSAWKTLSIDVSRKEQYFREGWRYITKITRNGAETKKLQLAFLAMFAERVVITVADDNVSLTPSVDDALSYLKKFHEMLGSECRVFVVDSYQPSTNFESIFGKVTEVMWGKSGDPLSTNAQELIIADTAHWGVRDFLMSRAMQDKLKKNVERIVIKFSPRNVIIVTTNKTMASVVSTWNLPKEVRLTWFRSEWMRGVPAEDRRVMIILGGPYLPKVAYVPQSKSFKVEDFISEMEGLQSDEEKELQLPRLLKLDDMRGEFINCTGRVKDPEGKQRSLVISFGVRKSEVEALLSDNSPFRLSKPKVTRTIYAGAMIDEGLVIAELWMKENSITNPQYLRMLARIICLARQKSAIPASQVLLGQTEIVRNIATKYQEVLKEFGVFVAFKTGGVTFESKPN